MHTSWLNYCARWLTPNIFVQYCSSNSWVRSKECAEKRECVVNFVHWWWWIDYGKHKTLKFQKKTVKGMTLQQKNVLHLIHCKHKDDDNWVEHRVIKILQTTVILKALCMRLMTIIFCIQYSVRSSSLSFPLFLCCSRVLFLHGDAKHFLCILRIFKADFLHVRIRIETLSLRITDELCIVVVFATMHTGIYT